MNPAILDFSEISLNGHIVRALRKINWKLDEAQIEDFDLNDLNNLNDLNERNLY
jgi:hypothetical protein